MVGDNGALIDPSGTVHLVRPSLEEPMPVLFIFFKSFLDIILYSKLSLTIEVARRIVLSVSLSITLIRKLSPTFPEIKGPGY